MVRVPSGRHCGSGVPCPPPKVRVFAWWLASNTLAARVNKFSRNMDTSDICILCGMERHNTSHTFFSCLLARAVWKGMEKFWRMPQLEQITNTRKEWLLHLFSTCNEAQRLSVLMTLWRVWHVHNEVVHHRPAPPTKASTRFLDSYINSLLSISQHPHDDQVKGKMVAMQ